MLSELQKHAVETLLDELLELPEASRAQHLSASSVDPAVRAEVESLLRAMGTLNAVPGFLARGARLTETAPEHPDASAHNPETAAPEVRSEMRLGPWLIGERIGRGGMGDVYRARRADGTFEQQAAVKLLQPEAIEQLERFRAERQILARLEHPGIARLLDGGIAPDGRPYMVMEYVEGIPITDFCAATHATLSERLALFRQVCDAVAYAHRNLIVHRDLKPSNILVTAERQVKLLDFGIAKPIDSRTAHLTRAADVVLTPMCAAPEQLTGKPVTTATDVYALGLLLYSLLTGQHAWPAAEGFVVLALRLSGKAVSPPSRVAAGNPAAPVPSHLIQGDLDAIVAKALREEPAQRYPTVDALKRDVDHHLAGEPVQAREGARLYVMSRLLRRYRWPAAALVLVILSLAFGLGMAAWQAHLANIERDIAVRDAQREEAVRYSLTRLFRSAISDHSGTEPATAKGMIDNSAERVLAEYRDQPQLAGTLVLTLADLYGALEDVNGAGALLSGYLKQAGPASDPAVVADARTKMANIELLSGHFDRASQLLDEGQVFFDRQGDRYPEERLEALGIRAKLQRQQGDLPGSIAASRQAIEARIAYTGRNHRETAVLYNSLAISLTANNQLEDALAAYQQALDIYRAVNLGDDLDAQVVLANIGSLDFRIGRLNEAQNVLSAAIARERALAGDSAAVAAAMGYLGKVQSIRDQPQQAVTTLTQAVEMAQRYTGATTPLAMQNRLFLGEAQLMSGDLNSSRATLDATASAALAQYGPHHLIALRLQLAQGRLLVAAGRLAEGVARIDAAVAGLRKIGLAGQSNLTLALMALGEARMLERQPAAAVTALNESVSLYQKAHYNGWELATARERLGEAYAAAGEPHRAQELLTEAARQLQGDLGAEHPDTRRARLALNRIGV